MRFRNRISLSVVLVLGMIASDASAQGSSGSAAPTQADDVVWKQLVPLHDGRVFITDTSFTLDVALAKPAVRPTRILSDAAANLIEKHMAAQLPDEFALSELKPRADTKQYVAPSGLVLNALYVDYLRRTLPGWRLHLRMQGDMEPVVILLDGKSVGLLMPMKR